MAIMSLTALDYCTIFVVCLGMLDLRCVRCLFVSDINVPQIVDFRDNVTLSCSYDMSGHTLNSVKWYKDKMEFFRYSPLMHPVYMKFPVEGLQLKPDSYFCNESSCRVELCALSSKSTGVYRCEVSGDAPHFKLTARTANMTVAALPQRDPSISGYHGTYRFDDFVQLNCSTDFTSLPLQLHWFVNGAKASYVDLQPSIETTLSTHEYKLRQQTLQLSFYANEPRFHQSASSGQKMSRSLEVRCQAEIENYPELRRESALRSRLLQDDDLSNQQLINSAATKLPTLSAISMMLLLMLPLLNIVIRKSSLNQHIKSRFKSAATSAKLLR